MSVVLLFALYAPAPEEKPAPKGVAELQGVWKITAIESRGVARPANAANPANPANPAAQDQTPLVVVGGDYVLRTHAGTLIVDREKKTVDMIVTEGRYKGTTLPGIFELKGTTLDLAFPNPGRNAERPKEMKTGPGTTHMHFTFERDRAATKEQAAAKLKELKESLPGAGFPAGRTGPASSTQQLLRQVLEKLDRIEKRLDEIEKKTKGKN